MDSLEKELAAVEKREKKLLAGGLKKGKVKQAVYEKVPEKVSGLLEAAFSKAFKTVFINGTPLIERTFDKEGAGLEFEARDYIVDRAGNKKSLRRLDKQAKKDSKINHAATTAAGLGLGFLGLGLPDIPLMVGTILRGVYEIAIGYGVDYGSEEEKRYIPAPDLHRRFPTAASATPATASWTLWSTAAALWRARSPPPPACSPTPFWWKSSSRACPWWAWWEER